MLECIVVLSLYPEMQKHLIIKIGFCFGNFNELNQKTPTFMYCFFKLKWLFYVLSIISNLIKYSIFHLIRRASLEHAIFAKLKMSIFFVVRVYIPFRILNPKRAIDNYIPFRRLIPTCSK